MKILIILFWLYSSIAHAQVYKCLGDNGKIIYTDIKCDSVSIEPTNARKPNIPIEQPKKNLFALELNLNSVVGSLREAANHYFYQIVFLLYLLMSRFCYCAYRKDKKYAKTQQWRVPESTLHLYEIFGGWPGGLIAQRKLRHKNKKLSYQISFWLIVALHIVGWYDYFMLNHLLIQHIIAFISSSA